MAGKKPLFSADAAEEYFSTLLTYYRNTGNDIFKRDNEGRHVSDQIYSAEYQKYLGMQIAMHEVLEYFAKFELGDTALRQQETVTNRNGLNEPMTLGELRSAYKFGCPVWLVGMEDGDGWVFIHHVDSCSVRYARVGDPKEWCFRTKSYGVRVFAYLDGPKEEQRDSD